MGLWLWCIVLVLLSITLTVHCSTHRSEPSTASHLRPSINQTNAEQVYTFSLPAAIPQYPGGNGFAHGHIDLGGLEVYEANKFYKVWSIYDLGINSEGLSFYEPALLPDGYYLLGHYARPHSRALSTCVLVGKDTTRHPSNPSLQKPVRFDLLWQSEEYKLKKDGEGYVWVPVAPQGYRAVGYFVTRSNTMPNVDRVRCVREDFTANLEADTWLWSLEDFTFYTSRPMSRGPKVLSVPAGVFTVTNGKSNVPPIYCLKRLRADSSSMPTDNQVKTILNAYSPVVYFHSEEEYLPSSVSWFFDSGAKLHRSVQDKYHDYPQPIKQDGSNLPTTGGINDSFIDLPEHQPTQDILKKGNLQSARAYVHVKENLGATFTDLMVYLFYPFNGPYRAQIMWFTVKPKWFGQHVGDWQHLTLRVDNFNGALKSIFLEQHNEGQWFGAQEFRFARGNKPIVYSSLHRHNFYNDMGRHFGLEMQTPSDIKLGMLKMLNASKDHPDFQANGGFDLRLRDETDHSDKVMDVGEKYDIIHDRPWLHFTGRWGPIKKSDWSDIIDDFLVGLSLFVKPVVKAAVKRLPEHLTTAIGTPGPMTRDDWFADEIENS